MPIFVNEIRGIVNSEITNEFASNLGTIIGNFLSPGKSVVVGRDNNKQPQMIKRSITAGILAAGIDVIDFGEAPIPVVLYGAKNLYDIDVNVTVTASHLHAEEIDIKIYSGHEIPLEQQYTEKASWENIGHLSYVQEYVDEYKKAVLENIERDPINSMAPKVVVDCANGSTVPFLPQILSNLGCDTVLFGSQTTDISIKEYAEPSPESISLVSNVVKAVGADMGIALDTDGDRIVFIDENGDVIRDQTTLGIFAREALMENPNGTIVSSVVASRSLDDITSEYGGKLIKTAVNSVLNEIIENKAVFGGDEPGIFVFPKLNESFDAIYAAVKMLEIICKHKTNLSSLAENIPKYQRTGFAIECEHDKKANVIENLEHNLGAKGVLNTTDGIRVDWEDSYILVRPSRFEALLRIYVEAKSPEKLHKLSSEIKEMIGKD